MTDLIGIGLKDVIDIVLVATLLFYIYKLMKESRSANLFIGLLFFVLAWLLVSQVFEMRLLGGIFDKLINVGSLALIVLFQEEIRSFFATIGRQRDWFFVNWFRRTKEEDKVHRSDIMPIVMACMSMGKQKVGALIVIERAMPLTKVAESGEEVDAIVSQRLIENIFFKNSPLHDGAMIIGGNRIVAARCTLPITDRSDLPARYGMRHKAAVGISEQSDADVIVVSEETGGISFVRAGVVTRIDSVTTLKLKLGGQAE